MRRCRTCRYRNALGLGRIAQRPARHQRARAHVHPVRAAGLTHREAGQAKAPALPAGRRRRRNGARLARRQDDRHDGADHAAGIAQLGLGGLHHPPRPLGADRSALAPERPDGLDRPPRPEPRAHRDLGEGRPLPADGHAAARPARRRHLPGRDRRALHPHARPAGSASPTSSPRATRTGRSAGTRSGFRGISPTCQRAGAAAISWRSTAPTRRPRSARRHRPAACACPPLRCPC